jgi:hypothetical protein
VSLLRRLPGIIFLCAEIFLGIPESRKRVDFTLKSNHQSTKRKKRTSLPRFSFDQQSPFVNGFNLHSQSCIKLALSLNIIIPIHHPHQSTMTVPEIVAETDIAENLNPPVLIPLLVLKLY